MTKLCPRGKAAAKRKFRVYPSAYANAYASKICAGKIKDPSGVKRKDFRGRKPGFIGGLFNKEDDSKIKKNKEIKKTKGVKEDPKRDQKKQPLKIIKENKESKQKRLNELKKELGLKVGGRVMREMGGPTGLNSKKRENLLIKKFGPRKFKPGLEKIIKGGPPKGRPVSKRPLPISGSRREKVSPEMNAKLNEQRRRELSLIKAKPPKSGPRSKPRPKMMGGGLMEATQRLRRQGLKVGGRGCKLAMKGRGRAYGKNS